MQSSFTDLEYAAKKKLTRRDRFLAEIDAVTPWAALAAELEPFYPKGKGRGRPPVGLERMLRMYFGLDGEAPRTLEEIGRSFDVSKERVRQLESRALEKLRDTLSTDKNILNDFVGGSL